MGSSNVSCAISNLSISGGEEVAFIFINPNKYFSSHKPKTSLVYSVDAYMPVTLPVIGKYDSYWSIEEVQEDRNTKAIEDFFELKIVDLVESVATGESPNNYLVNYYDFLIKYRGFDYAVPKGLIDFGFEQKEPNLFYHPQKEFWVRLDNEKILLEKDGEVVFKNKSNEPLRFLYEHLEFKYDIELDIDYQNKVKLELVSSMSGMFILKSVFDEVTNGANLKAIDSYFRGIKKADYDKYLTVLKAVWEKGNHAFINLMGSKSFGLDMYSFSYVYQSADEELFPFVETMYNLDYAIFLFNKFYAPTYNGHQDGLDEAAVFISELTGKIAKERLAKWQ